MHKKILIVDDDQAIISAVKTILTQENYSTLTATTGQDSIQCAKKEQPSLILLDYMLPDMTADQIVTKLRQDKDMETVPIVLISANHGLRELCKGLPIQEIIEKPFDIDVLTTTVAKYLPSN